MAALLCMADPLQSGAQQLIVPLSGQRHRPIETRSLFHTLTHDFFRQPDGTTYVQTGDIPAMWLRDAASQTLPYVRFIPAFPQLRPRVVGVIQREAQNILIDPYANAFMADGHVWERKWEVDSLAWPVLLLWAYEHETHDQTIFTPTLHRALRLIVHTYACQQRHATCDEYRYPYHVDSRTAFNPSTGMIWSAFRPSDDPVRYHFNIPQNALAVIALRDIAWFAQHGYHDRTLSHAAGELAREVFLGIERYGTTRLPEVGRIYVYETDGYGHNRLIDDANIPNLTTLPYIGWCSAFDPIYLQTRAFALGNGNPYYYRGFYAMGLGSAHTPEDFIWPLGIIGRALTATSSLEVSESISELAQTDSERGLIHESFYDNGYWKYTRADFGWANALYAELLFRSLAGFSATPFAPGGTIIPFEHISQTPRLVPLLLQLHNTAELETTLGHLLSSGG